MARQLLVQVHKKVDGTPLGQIDSFQIPGELGAAGRTWRKGAISRSGAGSSLLAGTSWLDDFRSVFGGEQQDYASALQRNYQVGPMPGWEQQHVSAYASVHPWEDWAEMWAHYLHMVDTLDTALSFGLDTRRLEMEIDPFGRDVLFRPNDAGAKRFLSFLNA